MWPAQWFVNCMALWPNNHLERGFAKFMNLNLIWIRMIKEIRRHARTYPHQYSYLCLIYTRGDLVEITYHLEMVRLHVIAADNGGCKSLLACEIPSKYITGFVYGILKGQRIPMKSHQDFMWYMRKLSIASREYTRWIVCYYMSYILSPFVIPGCCSSSGPDLSLKAITVLQNCFTKLEIIWLIYQMQTFHILEFIQE